MHCLHCLHCLHCFSCENVILVIFLARIENKYKIVYVYPLFIFCLSRKLLIFNELERNKQNKQKSNPPIYPIFSLIVSDKPIISSIKYYQIIFYDLLDNSCLYCLFISNSLKINHLSRNNALFTLFTLFLLRECHFVNSLLSLRA